MRTREPKSQSTNDLDQFTASAELFAEEPIDLIEKIEAFPKYASRQAIAKFLTKYEIFKLILPVNGSIIECGVLHGGGLLAWAKLSSLLEPANHPRKVIGFDTFAGFPGVHAKDVTGGEFHDLRQGGLTGTRLEWVERSVEVYDLNRPIAHIPKVELVPGNLCDTAPRYVADNPHLVVSLLYLDVDLYEPTKAAIEAFRPLMPKGAVIVFDELNAKIFPGETIAAHETLKLSELRLRRFPFDSYVSYAVLE